MVRADRPLAPLVAEPREGGFRRGGQRSASRRHPRQRGHSCRVAALLNQRRGHRGAGGRFIPEGRVSYPWDRKSPVWKLKHDTNWIDPVSGQTVTYRKWTEYILLRYGSYTAGDRQNTRWDYDKLIDRHPDIANGWTK